MNGDNFIGDLHLDFSIFWTWFLLFTRMAGVFNALPGIGTDSVPAAFRLLPAMIVGACITLSGIHAHAPASLAEGAAMVGAEYALGYVLGYVPQLVLGGLAVAGHLVSGSIGLAQANMIDASLGENVTVISLIKIQLATLLFLVMEGHHIVIRAAAGIAADIGIGEFRPGADTFQVLLDRFVSSFHLAIVVAAPIIVSALLTQFVLGLVTKFVPQVNIFIVSLPLTLLAGLFIVQITLPGLFRHTELEFSRVEETLSTLMFDRSDTPRKVDTTRPVPPGVRFALE